MLHRAFVMRRHGDLWRDYSSEPHQGEAPSNKQCVGSSGDTDDMGPCLTSLSNTDDVAPLASPLAEAAVPLGAFPDTPQPSDPDIWQPRAPKDDNRLDSGYSTDQDDAASMPGGKHERSASESAFTLTIATSVVISAQDQPPLPWPSSPPSFLTPQTVHKTPESMLQAHIHSRFSDSQRADLYLIDAAYRADAPITRPRVHGKGDADNAAPFPCILEGTAAFLTAFPAFSEPQDANTKQRRALLDTGQRPCLANSSTTRVRISNPQHSTLGAPDSPETAEAALLSACNTAMVTTATAAESPVANRSAALMLPATPMTSPAIRSTAPPTAWIIPVWQHSPVRVCFKVTLDAWN